MRSVVYENLIHIGQNLFNSQDEADVVKQAIQWNNSHDLSLSIKKYGQNNGLSKHIHEQG